MSSDINNPSIGQIRHCWGTGSNHVRWMLFLDHRFPNVFNGCSDINDRMSIIKEYGYPSGRTWRNWLNYERRCRKVLDDILNVSDSTDMHTTDKLLFLCLNDVEKAINHYYHVNLSLNNKTKDEVMIYFNEWTNNILGCSMDGITRKAIISDCIYDPVLNYEWYKSIVDFFGFDDNYEYAKQVHEIYYQLRKKSARDFCEYFSSDEFQKYKQMMYEFGHQ